MKFYLKLLFTVSALLAISLLSTSCRKKEKILSANDNSIIETKGKTHFWYYFTTGGFEKTDLPQNAPALAPIPWTESIRICASGVSTDMNNQQTPLSYALVNRLGLLVFDEGEPVIHSDRNLFTESTMGTFVMQDNNPFFSLYKSSFFNEKANISTSSNGKQTENIADMRPFLIRYDVESGIFFPMITYENLQLESNEQITDFTWNGKQLNCSIKTTEGKNSESSRNKFSYFTVTPSVPILSISPKTAPSTIFIGESTAESFRNSKKLEDLSSAPDRLKKLIAALPKDLPILMEVSFSGNSSEISYQQALDEEKSAMLAKAIIADTWALAVFEDGTCYFSGSCYGRPIINSGKTVAFRLPKLPENFTYSYFALTGTKLYVAWEETSFYQTGRSGFIFVDLDSVLYSQFRNEK